MEEQGILITDSEQAFMYDGLKWYCNKTELYFQASTTEGREVIHRYVWTKYNGPIPQGFVIHHIDGNKLNNKLDNLQMMTAKEHLALHKKERISNGYKSRKNSKNLVKCNETNMTYNTIREASQATGISPICIHYAISEKRKTAGKYTWCLVNKEEVEKV